MKHYRFNKTIVNCVQNQDFQLMTITEEQKQVRLVIDDIHTMYMSQLDSIRNENDMKNSLLTQWIHNIKTPISVIDLILQKESFNHSNEQNIVENDKLCVQNRMSDIKIENDKSIELLESLLTIIRMEHFSSDYMIESVNLNEQIYKLINEKKSQFIYNRVFPKVLTEKEDYIVLTDQKWNELMLDQIISNAIKYSNAIDQSKYIYFSLAREEKWTKLTIRDEGIGISQYDQHRIFEPFVTGDNGRIIHNSTGIGLHICQLIAK